MPKSKAPKKIVVDVKKYVEQVNKTGNYLCPVCGKSEQPDVYWMEETWFEPEKGVCFDLSCSCGTVWVLSFNFADIRDIELSPKKHRNTEIEIKR